MEIQYNALQLEAIHSNSDKILVTACPGAGKSTSLVGAISYYLTEHPKANVIAITFTRKAADDLSDKLSAYPTVTPSTIHSWSLRQLRELAFEHHFIVRLLQEEEIKEILRHLCKKVGFYNIQEFWLYLYVTGNYNMDISEVNKRRYERIAREYIQYKRDNSLYDFMDLPLYLYDKLEEYGVNIEGVDGLFVDEFQDVDPVQAQVFNRVAAKKKFFIGDERQAIYKFRGADSSVLNDLDGFDSYTLNINYRSGQDILDFASTLYNTVPSKISDITDITDYGEDRIIGSRNISGRVIVCGENGIANDLTYGDVNSAYTFLIGYIYKNNPYILCRSNKIVKAIKKLGYSNVSTIHQAKGLEYKDVLVVDFDIDPDNEEELNIAFVACTRAKDSLVIANYEVLERVLKGKVLQNNFRPF